MTIYPDIDLNRWEVENNCNVVLANADYYYTKGQVDKKIDDIETSGVTEEKAQEMIDKSLQDYYSKGETDSFINKLEETDTTISGVVNVLDETVDGISNRVSELYSELSERAVASSFGADVQSDYIDLQFRYQSGWGKDEDSEINYVELPSATRLKAGVMSAEDKRKLDNTYTKTEVNDAISAATSGKADTSAVTEAIDAIDAAYKAADAVISGAVDNVSGDVVTEAQRAQNAETALNSKIDEVSGAIPSVESYFDGAEYDSNAKRINFKHGDTVKTYIDATDFIKDGMVSNVEIINDNLVITFNSDAGKETITIPLTDIFNPNNYYTKSDANDLLDDKADKVNTYTKTEVDAVLSGKQETLISGTNIKTINNESILGSGNITINVTVDSELSTTSENPVQNKVITNTLNEKERAISIALNDLEERKIDESGLTEAISAATNDMATQTWVSGFTYNKTATDNLLNAKADTTALGGLTLVKLTQAEYDALATKDSNTLYVIVG